MDALKPQVGVAVLILKEGKVLLQLRTASHGANQYAFTGGHLEYMESIEDCAKRETREEAGIEIDNIRFLLLYNMKAYAPKHYVHINMVADWRSGEPRVLESAKTQSWAWYDLNDLPEPIFDSAKVALDCYKSGFWPKFIDG